MGGIYMDFRKLVVKKINEGWSQRKSQKTFVFLDVLCKIFLWSYGTTIQLKTNFVFKKDGFYRTGIEKLHGRWQKVLENNGHYVIYWKYICLQNIDFLIFLEKRHEFIDWPNIWITIYNWRLGNLLFGSLTQFNF